MARVLRLKVGDQVELADGRGSQALATVVEVLPQSITLEVAQPQFVTQSNRRTVTLYAAIAKRENFEWIVQKATEIGVARIVPLQSARTVKLGIKMDRLRKIAQEAAEQCGRADVPEISEPMAFDVALADPQKPAQNFFFDTSASEHADFSGASTLGIWIGPEGGWTGEEVSAAEAAGCRIVSLGSLTLRAETAATVASFLAVGG